MSEVASRLPSGTPKLPEEICKMRSNNYILRIVFRRVEEKNSEKDQYHVKHKTYTFLNG